MNWNHAATLLNSQRYAWTIGASEKRGGEKSTVKNFGFTLVLVKSIGQFEIEEV